MNTKRGGCGGWLGGGAGGGGGWVGVGREGREGVVIVKIGVGCLGRGGGSRVWMHSEVCGGRWG